MITIKSIPVCDSRVSTQLIILGGVTTLLISNYKYAKINIDRIIEQMRHLLHLILTLITVYINHWNNY